jgi:hypothetical protein
MHKSATKCNETICKWCKNKHGASKIIDTFETYQLPFCHDLYPPNQPADAESELKMGQLKNHILLWPKALIRLNTALRSEACQERVTPLVVSAAPSQGKVAPPSMPEAMEERPDTPPTYDPPEHDGAMDIDQAPIDTFIADLEADDAP